MTSKFLDTRQLEAFVAVISTGSMTAASKVLGISQPVITRLIKELEQDVGFDVLRRNGPRIALTERGVSFFSEAQVYLNGLETIASRARGLAESRPKAIEIACSPSVAATVVPLALASLSENDFPEKVLIQSASTETVVHAVAARTIDLGVVSLPIDSSGVDMRWIGDVPCVAVVANSDPLASAQVIQLSELTGRRLIASANPYRLRRRIDEALEQAGARPKGVIENNVTSISLTLAREGVGVAIVESASLLSLRLEGITVVPLKERIPFYFGAITGAGRPGSATVDLLLAAIEEQAGRVPGFRLHANLQNITP